MLQRWLMSNGRIDLSRSMIIRCLIILSVFWNPLNFVNDNGIVLFFKCSSDSDCTDDTDANRCVSGQCVCGSTGGKCTTTSGKPVCTKSSAFSTAATSAEGTSAVCSVNCYFFSILVFLFVYNNLQ